MKNNYIKTALYEDKHGEVYIGKTYSVLKDILGFATQRIVKVDLFDMDGNFIKSLQLETIQRNYEEVTEKTIEEEISNKEKIEILKQDIEALRDLANRTDDPDVSRSLKDCEDELAELEMIE